MKILLFLITIFCWNIFPQEIIKREVGNLILENIPEFDNNLVQRMSQYQNIRSASFNSWDPNSDGMLITTKFSETNQIHFVDKPGSRRYQITFFNEPINGASFYPNKDKKAFIFTMDKGGNEFFQIYSFDLTTGNYELLTDGSSRNQAGPWNNKGNSFVFTTTKRNGKDNDIYLYDYLKKSASLLLEVNGSWSVTSWSPDDNKLLIEEFISAERTNIYLFDIQSKKLDKINEKEDAIYRSARFSRDGKGIFFLTNENNNFQYLAYYDFKTKKINIINSEKNWNVEAFNLSKDGKWLVYSVNEYGFSKLKLMNLLNKKFVPLPEIPPGVYGSLSFNHKSDKLALTINSSVSPGDVFSIDLKNMKLERWTYSEIGGLNQSSFINPEIITYPTFDKVNGDYRKISAIYYHPKVKKYDKFPVLIDIHGGPEGQSRPVFSPFIQFLINELGIVVIQPNVRGSTGYGKEFLALDNGFNREKSVDDIGKLIEWIENQSELDASRIAVIGGSYGGYMVLSSLFRFNQKLKCGVDMVGISNFITFLENTQPYRRDLRRVEYGDERIPEMREFLISISPVNNAHKIKAPLLVSHGMNDPRVPYSEAQQIIEIVRKNNVPVWSVIAKDEGHGFSKKFNREFYYNSVVAFLKEYLLK